MLIKVKGAEGDLLRDECVGGIFKCEIRSDGKGNFKQNGLSFTPSDDF
ncbi:MAG: hypothetical protein K9H58_05915 [Bacteroidales bacterium]|nr:hypothetical protein [Bacteroidales bacterium]